MPKSLLNAHEDLKALEDLVAQVSSKTLEQIAVPSADAPPIAPGDRAIDRDHLSRMTFGECSLEREVLELFDRQASMLLARMPGEPATVVAALAHTLGGSARGIGAWQVAEAAEGLERLAASPEPQALGAAIDRLSGAVAEARAAITEVLRAA